MRMGLLGKKIGMTQIFNDAGLALTVTLVDASGCVVTQKKIREKDGYSSLQVAIGARKQQNQKKSRLGHLKKAGAPSLGHLQEIRVQSDDEILNIKNGDTLSVKMFVKGDFVDVVGVTKGKGFQGVVKRHGFHGADASHGVHEYFRHGGSIGTNTFPGRVLKNKGMPGQTGSQKRTVQNIQVLDVIPKDNLLLLGGAIPGTRNGMVLIRSSKKVPPPKDRAWV